jgi:hypothetical protein
MQWRRAGSLFVLVFGLGNMVAEPLRALRDARDTDYASFVSAARILAAGSRDLYSLATQHAAEAAYLGFTPPPSVANAFLNPAPAALALVPLTGLSRTAGLAIFLSAAFLCVAISLLLVLRHLLTPVRPARLRAVIGVATVCSLPAGMTLALGQWDPFILVAETLGLIWIAQRRRQFWAGLLISVVILKPQLGVLIPIFLLASGQWRALGGMVAGGALWLAGSFAILGSHLADWPRLIIENDSATTIQTLGLPGLAGMFSGSTRVSELTWLLVTAAAVACAFRWRGRLTASPTGAVALGMGASLVVAPHLWSDDLILFALPLVWWARTHPQRALITSIVLSATWGVDVAIGPITGPHLETFVILGAVIALALSFRRTASSPDAAQTRAPWPPARALPSTPR